MSVSRCMREVSSAEFAEWVAYASIEPFGPTREDQRAGMIAALIANVNRDPSKRSKPYDVEDFFPAYGEQEPTSSGEPSSTELESKIMAWAAKMNAANDVKGKSQTRPKG